MQSLLDQSINEKAETEEKIEYVRKGLDGVLDRYKEQLNSQLISIEPGHEKMCLMSYANNKGADQPAHLRSLISAFVVRCLDSIISLDSIDEISRL